MYEGCDAPHFHYTTIMELKRCTQCGEEKPLSEFHKGSRGKLASECKPCAKDRAQRYRQAHPERARATSAAYRAKNKEALSLGNYEYRMAHKEHLQLTRRKYYEKNKEKIAAKQKAYREANLDKRREKDRLYRLNNPEKMRAHSQRQEKRRRVTGRERVRALKRDYGLTLTEFHAALKKQANKCYICGRGFSLSHGRATMPNVDHDHKTGAVRKLLCINCNIGLSNFQENPELLKAAIKYLLVH